METQIRIVWILSLISALLAIAVQGYWLYNQYQFVFDGYSTELARQVLEAGDEEYAIRQKRQKQTYTFIVNKQTEYTKANDTIAEGERKRLAFQFISALDKQGDSPNVRPDSVRLSLSIDPDLSQEAIQANINRAIANYFHPFSQSAFDSLLIARMPGLSFEILPWAASDTLYTSRWERAGGLFSPHLRVAYAYSPFQKEGVVLNVPVPAQPLFSRMAVQLLLAFGLILLLLGCLIFQIRTILRQRKIGELRQSFVNTMIHELKRPVQTLKSFVAFLGDKEMRADEQLAGQVVQDSMFELDNLGAYLQKLKDMVRADNRETPLHVAPFDLEELTERVIRLTHIPAGKEVDFSKYFDMESPVIEADPIHLANVLSNLIENAIKYSGDTVHIEIKARLKNRELRLTVADDGIGIPLAEQDKVFAKFYRGSNLPDRNLPGLGLGLSYVKLISEAHHGRVSLQSHVGQGTSVTLFLPQ